MRTRRYVDTATQWLEVKQRCRGGRTDKVRIAYDGESLTELSADAKAFVSQYPWLAERVDDLAAVLQTVYVRTTLLAPLPQRRHHLGRVQRCTIDVDLTWTTAEGLAFANVPRAVIIETKSPTAHGGPVDRALWRSGVRPESLSKYTAGMATQFPNLGRHRWKRFIERHIETVPPIVNDVPTALEYSA